MIQTLAVIGGIGIIVVIVGISAVAYVDYKYSRGENIFR